jgi:hypothetical protein
MCTGWRRSSGCPATGKGVGRATHPGEADGGNSLLWLRFMPTDTGERPVELCSAAPVGAGERGAGKLGRWTMAAARAREGHGARPL